MKPAITYEGVCKSLASSNYKSFPDEYRKVKLIGILFARPDAKLSKEEFIPQFSYFNQASGKDIDFFCAGYTDGWTTQAADGLEYTSTGIKANEREWAFSNDSFISFSKEISSRSRWKYSGECDLILLNTFYDSDKQSVELDFSMAIVCQLDQMKKDEAIPSLAEFFQKIFNHVNKDPDQSDPCVELSNSLGSEKGGPALIRFILSFLPKDLGKDFARLAWFTTKDISKVSVQGGNEKWSFQRFFKRFSLCR